MDRANERLQWAWRNVGTPALAVETALQQLRHSIEFSGVRFDAIAYYFDRVLRRYVLEQMDAALTTERVAHLHPDVVKVCFIMLLRDLCRHHRGAMVSPEFPEKWDGQWVELLTAALLNATNAPIEPYVEWMTIQDEGEEEDAAVLVAGLAAQLGINADELFNVHLAMLDVVYEDLLTSEPSVAEG